jgi:predicted nucleic acid-binding protein
MALLYLDTSAILKRYRTEKGTHVVNELYEGAPRLDTLFTSHFSCLEFESVAARALKGKLLTQQAYEALLGSFSQDLGEYLRLVEASGDVINEAIDAARKYALRAPDAVQFASAARRRPTIFFLSQDFVFVSSDKELLAATESVGMKVLDPEAEDAMDALRKLRTKK